MRQIIMMGIFVLFLTVGCATTEGGSAQPQQPVQPFAVTDAGGKGYFVGSIYGVPIEVEVDGGVVGEEETGEEGCVGIKAKVLAFEIKGALPLKGKAAPTPACVEKHGGILAFPTVVQGGTATNADASP